MQHVEMTMLYFMCPFLIFYIISGKHHESTLLVIILNHGQKECP
jgi:hypothetical protein